MSILNRNALIFLIVGLVVGFLARNYMVSDQIHLAEGNECQEQLNTLKYKFEKISDEDINEYIHLKDMKAKFEKADEIFGKILNIFLLDLGLRMSSKQIGDLKTASEAGALPHHASPNSSKDPKTEVSGGVQAPKYPPKQKTYINTQNINTDEQIKKIADDNLLENPLASWRSSAQLNRSGFNLINGHFFGQITFFDKDKTPWDVEMELTNASFDKGNVTAGFLLKTVDPSNPKHRDTTTGEAGSTITNFRSSDDSAILVEAMGGDGIFQLYYFPQLNSLQGNVYQRQGFEDFKRTGTIILNSH